MNMTITLPKYTVEPPGIPRIRALGAIPTATDNKHPPEFAHLLRRAQQQNHHNRCKKHPHSGDLHPIRQGYDA